MEARFLLVALLTHYARALQSEKEVYVEDEHGVILPTLCEGSLSIAHLHTCFSSAHSAPSAPSITVHVTL